MKTKPYSAYNHPLCTKRAAEDQVRAILSEKVWLDVGGREKYILENYGPILLANNKIGREHFETMTEVFHLLNLLRNEEVKNNIEGIIERKFHDIYKKLTQKKDEQVEKFECKCIKHSFFEDYYQWVAYCVSGIVGFMFGAIYFDCLVRR